MRKVVSYIIEDEDLGPLIIFLKEHAFSYIECMMEDHNINGLYELVGICNSLINEIEEIHSIKDFVMKVNNGDFSNLGILDLNDFLEDFDCR